VNQDQYIQFHVILDLVKLFLPLILIFGGIYWIYRRGAGSTFQKDILLESKRSADASEHIAANLDRIATALEQRQP
jgi:CRISPR/Cas system CMR-associated protein Cmr1 (group 7 of RAMP superfamily)